MSTASFTRMRSEERFRKASERLRDQIPNDLIIPLKEIKCPEFDGCAKVSDKVAQLQKSVESCIQAGKGQVGKPEQPRSDKIIEKTIASWFRAAYPFMTLLLGVVKESSQVTSSRRNNFHSHTDRPPSTHRQLYVADFWPWPR